VRPSDQLGAPHVIAGVNVIAADSSDHANAEFRDGQRLRVRQLIGGGRAMSEDEADAILDSPSGQQIKQMSKYSAVGTAGEVDEYFDWCIEHADADELIVASTGLTVETILRSFELLAEARMPAHDRVES